MAKQSTSGKNVKKVSPRTRTNSKKEFEEALNQIQLNTAMVSRAAMASALGQTYGGKRDLYEVLGYKKVLNYVDFFNAYDRDGIATRIVDTVSDETWRLHPVLSEAGVEKTDEYDQPSQLQLDFSELADKVDLWAKFADVDAACGISRFGLIYLGLPGDTDKEVEAGLSADDLAYVSVHDEGTAKVLKLDLVKDTNSPRFGLPEYYQITLDDENKVNKRVHWSRVIHVKEGRSKSRIYGVARLQPMFNRILDLEKVVGSSSEAFYQLIYRGMALEAREGYKLPDKDSDEYKAMQDELDEFEHGLRRFLRLSGMEAKDLGGKPVDGDQQFNLIISYLAGSSHIPQRILIGSERGELASSQDDFNFYGFIKTRQVKFAEPYILRPTIKRLGELGILNVPAKYDAEWPSLFEPTEKEKVDIASTAATAINVASNGAPETIITPEDFGKRFLGIEPKKPEEELAQIEEALSPGDSLDKIIAKVGGGNGSTMTLSPTYDINKVTSALGGGNGKLKDALMPSGDRVRQVLANTFEDHEGRPGHVGGSLPRNDLNLSEEDQNFINKFPYLYHITTEVNAGKILKQGLKPSKEGYSGAGAYLAVSPEQTEYYLKPGQKGARMLRVKTEDLLRISPLRPRGKTQYDEDTGEVVFSGTVPAELFDWQDNNSGNWRESLAKRKRLVSLNSSSLRFWHNENGTSAMIALKIPDLIREELQKQYPFMNEETKNNLHITLIYLGDNRTLDIAKVSDAMHLFSGLQKPIKTKLQGLARFVAVYGGDDAIVATFDSPEFPDLFERLCNCLDEQGIPYHQDHGFIPHMTLAYIGKDEDMPAETVEPFEMNFSEVHFVNGEEWVPFEMLGHEVNSSEGQY